MRTNIITLQLPTSVNRTYKSGNGHFYKSQEARDWEEKATYALIKSGYRQKHKMIEGILGLRIDFYLKRDRDCDSGIKLLMDFLQNKVYRNDRQVKHLIVEKFEDKINPRVEITIL